MGQISKQKWENLKKPNQQWLGSFYTTYPEINNLGIFTTMLCESHDESLIYGWSTEGMVNPSIFPQYSQTLLQWDILPLEQSDYQLIYVKVKFCVTLQYENTAYFEKELPWWQALQMIFPKAESNSN